MEPADSGVVLADEWVRLVEYVSENVDLSLFLEGRGNREFVGFVHPERIVDISERWPTLAIKYLRVLKKLGWNYKSWKSERRIELKGVAQHLLNPHRIREMNKSDPLETVALVQLLYEMWGPEFFEYVRDNSVDAFLAGVMSPKTLSRAVATRDASGAIAYLRMVLNLCGEVNAEQFVDEYMSPEFVEDMFGVDRLQSIAEWDSGVAMEYLDLLGEHRYKKYFADLLSRDYSEMAEDYIRHRRGMIVEAREVAAVAVWLRIARMIGSRQFSRVVSGAIFRGVVNRVDAVNRISKLPISSIGDLRWLAKEVGDREIPQIVEDLLDSKKRTTA